MTNTNIDTLLAETGYQVYAGTYIEGAVYVSHHTFKMVNTANIITSDFIFGQHARAWFHECDIRVLEGPSSASITANGRSSESDDSYYVIHKSTVAAADGNDVSSGTYYLGMPLA